MVRLCFLVGLIGNVMTLSTAADAWLDKVGVTKLIEQGVAEIKKGTQKGNAFALGVTIGRTENNDIALSDASISRFHAYLMFDARAGVWKIVDAESRNGTWVNGKRLAENASAVLGDKDRVKLGDVELVFMEPPTFITYLTALAQGSP